MNSLELTPQQAAQGWRPLAGRILLEIEPNPEMEGSLYIPGVAREQTKERNRLLIGKVLAIGYGPFSEGAERIHGIAPGDVNAGDRVLLDPLMMDLNKRTLLTAVTRVVAVLED